LKATLAGAATAVWSNGARLARRFIGSTPAIWSSRGGQRVLVIAPHPDDEIGCSGTLLRHVQAGDTIEAVYVTDGRGSRAAGLGPDEMATRRKREAESVAPLLGIGRLHWLGLPEWDWQEAALVPLLRDLVREASPDIVYAPSRVDFHPEHVRVARCLALALAQSDNPQVRVYQLHVPLTPLLVNLVTPIQTVAPELSAAMRGYATQWGSIERCLRMKRYAGSFYHLSGLAEEFWELDPEAYRRVHALDLAAPDGAFRGVRARPFTDPLSYVRGIALRRRLRDVGRAG
jgi:LmbE family N-acetylglucosaminyl deacetylase